MNILTRIDIIRLRSQDHSCDILNEHVNNAYVYVFIGNVRSFNIIYTRLENELT